MDILDNSMKTVDSTLTGVLSDPKYYGLLAIFLAMYGPRLSPKLPKTVRNLFNNNYFRFAVILLVIYMSNNDLSMALIITIGFVLVMSLANSQEIEEVIVTSTKKAAWATYRQALRDLPASTDDPIVWPTPPE